MRAKEFTTKETRPSAEFINSQVDQQQWQKLGHGADVSVWAHIADPNTVVKIVGGGYQGSSNTGIGSILYSNFCYDCADDNKHFLRVLDINNDDPLVCQIRVERLIPLSEEYGLGDDLHALSDACEYGLDKAEYIDKVLITLEKEGLARYNKVENIVSALDALFHARYDYAKRFKVEVPVIDLHSANWMMRQDGTIVISDPWN